MVKGLERFREHFVAFADRYLIIGGTACDLALTAAGLEFRATKDIDVAVAVLDFEFDEYDPTVVLPNLLSILLPTPTTSLPLELFFISKCFQMLFYLDGLN